MIAAVLAWRPAKLTLECAIEGCLRLISDFAGDFGNASWRTLERPRCQLKPPTGQIGHGWFGEVSGKALHEGGPGNACLLRQIGDCPRMSRAAMQQSKAFSHDRIARSREPPQLPLRQAGDVPPQGIDEQSL